MRQWRSLLGEHRISAVSAIPIQWLYGLSMVILLVACASDPADSKSEPAHIAGSGSVRHETEGGSYPFVDSTESSGLDFVHQNGMTGELSMVEVLGAGAALFDYDRDGDLDLYLVQSGRLERGESRAGSTPSVDRQLWGDRLYRNETLSADSGTAARRPLQFQDQTARSGIISNGYGMGVAVGDYDRDGWPDLYVTRFGGNQLLRNNTDGSFEDVTAASGSDDRAWSVAATFFDYDRDGWLDLFVGNYVDLDVDKEPVCRDLTGAPDYCGPGVFPPSADRLFHNRGDGTFEEVSTRAGLDRGFGPALGVVAADLDGDGWLDLYVANDAAANNLWKNRGDGTFEDVALISGCAVNGKGKAEGSMGVDAQDVDGDGDVDLFMTHLTKETNTLFLNDGHGFFDDVTSDTGLGPSSHGFTAFGTAFIDYDRDGWLDLFVANGAVTHIEELVAKSDPFPLHQRNQLFHNLGRDGRSRGPGLAFEEVTSSAGPVFELSEVSRGAAFGDLDNDGDTDIVLTNNNGTARVLENRATGQHWLGVALVVVDERPIVGSRVAVVRPDGEELWRHVRVDGSYASSNDPRLLFGLARDPEVDAVWVVWPDGKREAWSDIAVDRYVELRRGSGRSVDS